MGSYLFRQMDMLPQEILFEGKIDDMRETDCALLQDSTTGQPLRYNLGVEALALDHNNLGSDEFAASNHRGQWVNVVYRDVQYIIESLLTVLFWICPIIYAPLAPDATLRSSDLLFHAYYLNPLSGILSAYRSVLYFGRAPDATTFAMATGITLLIGILGVWTFWRHEREFADLI